MILKQILAQFLLLLITVNAAYSLSCKPIGVRLSLGNFIINASSTQKLGIRFDTEQPCNKSYINIYRQNQDSSKIECDTVQLQFPNYTSYVHKCIVDNLKEGENISYNVYGWTGLSTDPPNPYKHFAIDYTFPQMDQTFRMIVLGDWGYLGKLKGKYKALEESFSKLLKSDKKIHALFIMGDIAYDLQSNNGQNYENFIRMISQISIKVPFIIVPGNHQNYGYNKYILNTSFETYGIFVAKIILLKLPQFNLILWDPYNILLANESTEVTLPSFKKVLEDNYESKQFAIVSSHYPYRCNGVPSDCVDMHMKLEKFYSALFQYNIPLYMSGHYHVYERTYPFIDNNSTYQPKDGPYYWSYDKKPEDRYLISIIDGAAGNQELFIQSYAVWNDWTIAYTYNVTGYGIIEVSQKYLQYRHYVSSNAFTPIDRMKIFLKRKKNSHIRK